MGKSETEDKQTEKRKTRNNPARAPRAKKEELTPRDQVFVNDYLVHLNPHRAALAAGYSETVARTRAFTWVANPEAKPLVYQAIQKAMEERSIRTQVTQDKVLEHLWNIVIADPNEIMQLRRNNCRHCHGINHEFQWKDEAEFQRALDVAIREEKAMQEEMPGYRATMPTDDGGYGFHPLNVPHEECPNCYGEGRLEEYIADTRSLSPSARALYAGFKRTKEGIEVKTNDKQSAIVAVARHLGMFNDKLTLKGDAENPLEVLLRSLPGNTLKPVDDD